MFKGYRKAHPRLTNHLYLGMISLLGCLIMVLLANPDQSILELLSIGTGYLGLGLLVVTLLIGPLNMLKVRRNPVNLMFRRDAGIWAGLNSLAHVAFAFALQLDWGGTLLGFFLFKDGSIKLNLFGISNYMGLLATLVIIFLMVLSNNWFLKALKGKRWKTMQRFNYLLFGVALVHTFTQQVNNARSYWLIVAVIAGTAAVMVGQFTGFVIYRQREQQRKAGQPATSTTSLTVQNGSITNIPGNRGYVSISKTKLASAFGLSAVLGIGVGLVGANFINNQTSALTGRASAIGNPEADAITGAETSANPSALLEVNEAAEPPATTTEAPTAIPTTTAATVPPTTTPAATATKSVPTASNNQASVTATSKPASNTKAATATPAPATKALAATPVPATKAPTATPVPPTKVPVATATPTTSSKSKTTITRPSNNAAPVHSGGS